MIDLQALMDTPGAGKAHGELCRSGHPTEFPRFPGEIEYHVDLLGPFGDKTSVEVMAESLQSAIAQARHTARILELVPVEPFEDDLIEVIKVRAYDCELT